LPSRAGSGEALGARQRVLNVIVVIAIIVPSIGTYPNPPGLRIEAIGVVRGAIARTDASLSDHEQRRSYAEQRNEGRQQH
jgi:hypothetical protein